MNEKFYCLSSEKQQRIINAAFKVFSQSDYKNAPMSEISSACGISKSLLFHYFKNKKELYLFLCKHAMNLTANSIEKFQVVDTNDFFEMLKRNMQAKCWLMREYPNIHLFSLKIYYEQNSEIKEDIQSFFSKYTQRSEEKLLNIINQTNIRRDINIKIMYQEIALASEGYLYQKYNLGQLNAEQIEKDFLNLIEHWRKIYQGNENL